MTEQSRSEDITRVECERIASDTRLLSEVPTDRSTKLHSAFVVIRGTENEQPMVWTLWLHWHMKRTCYYFKALYEYEAWVTTAADPGSPRFRVDEIQLHIRRTIDFANYYHSCANTDYCAKSDEVYNTGGACGRTCCGARATYQGVSWFAPENCMD